MSSVFFMAVALPVMLEKDGRSYIFIRPACMDGAMYGEFVKGIEKRIGFGFDDCKRCEMLDPRLF